jgi:hypothetical protein
MARREVRCGTFSRLGLACWVWFAVVCWAGEVWVAVVAQL